MILRRSIAAAFAAVCMTAHADEADQYSSWQVQLDDAAPVLNDFIARQTAEVLERVNAESPDSCTCEELTELIFENIYLDRFRQPLLDYVEESTDVDVHPDRDVGPGEILDQSIYRNVTLPSIIRVTRTVRVGDVYIGVDKLAHLFGIGRRYYARYRDMLQDDVPRQDAIDESIRWGVFTENSILGKVVNGIFSHADLEANYAGLRLAISFCEGDAPMLVRNGSGWALRAPIDLAQHVSPLFDESYNPSHYTGGVGDAVFPVIRETCANPNALKSAGKRFQAYGSIQPTRSTELVVAFFRTENLPFQRDDLLKTLGIDGAHPAAPVDLNALVDSNVRGGPESTK